MNLFNYDEDITLIDLLFGFVACLLIGIIAAIIMTGLFLTLTYIL